ncbi:MAG: type II toxin-antitoxin system VapC family toxin [Acidimicrobiia bacterium]|nr:type II toxin-antitoxin system VapC family toxin [Acidimicrobiia bacterium]
MIVPDASIIAAAVTDSGVAGPFARDLLRRSAGVAMPDFADVETTAVLRKRWTARALDDLDFLLALDALSALPFPRYPARAFLGRAYELRANLTPYDAVYVALAEALEAELVTADRRLAAAPGIRCRVRVIPPE